MKDQLDNFLGEDEPGVIAEQAPAPEPEAPTGETPQPEPVEKPEAPSDDGEPPAPEDVEGLRKALHATRNERKDYKGRAARLEGELAALKAEQEAYRKAALTPAPVQASQAVQPPVQLSPPPNPAEDPQGYAAWFENKLINDRANYSESVIRDEKGSADVDAKLALFRQAAQANPKLQAALRIHPDPWRFAYEQGASYEAKQEEQARAAATIKEIGPDLEAYKAKVLSEARAAWEAEVAAANASVPRVSLPQSLGTARSAAPRGAVAAIPEDFDDILRRNKR